MLASIRWQRVVALSIALLAALALVVGSAQNAEAYKPYKKHSDHAAKKRLEKIDKAKRVAKRQKGDGYRYGSSGPKHFDCSGLTKYAFKKADISMPRTSQAQYDRTRHIKKRNLKKGDLIFFGGKNDIYHVGIYWGKPNGNRLVLHAPGDGESVKVEKVWTSNYHAGTVRWRH